MSTVEVNRDLLLELEAIADSELQDMRRVDPDLEGEWSQRVKQAVDEVDEVLR